LTPPPEEVEVKLPCPDLSAVRERLAAEGAALKTERHEESNRLYDDPEGRFAREGRTLRLRLAGDRAVLTYKGAAHFEGGVKRREEREVEVSDLGETAAILERLGFVPRFRYDKRREEWTLAGCTVALDDTPIGSFVEVEGDPRGIRKVVSALELDFTAAIPYSYARLYREKRQAEPSLPEDMVFPDGR
jgi:adenylate cyclase class 2